MRKRYWFGGLTAFVLGLVALCGSSAYAQLTNKSLPTLSLVKMFSTGTSNETSKDTLYVAEPGPGEKRYFLLPIYVKNCLSQTTDPVTGASGEPIYSFRFKLQYNRTLLRAVGLQKRGNMPYDTTILAKDFNMSWDVDQDPTYKESTTGAPSANGERIMVTGSSATPLPLSPSSNPGLNSCQFRDTTVLVYILFEVVGTGGSGSGVNRDQLILTRDSIMWNEYSVTNVTPEMRNRGFEPYQAGVAPSPIIPVTYPNNYGTSIVQITVRPRIQLLPPSQVVTVNGDESNYELVTHLQTYYGVNTRIFRNILLTSGVPGAYLRNVVVETDAAWLRIDTSDPGTPPGVGEGGDPPAERGVFLREVGAQLNFNVIANPSAIPTQDGNSFPTPGVYIGYVTLRSADAVNSAVRLKVVLRVTRNPLEPTLTPDEESQNPFGIRLLVRNSAPLPDTTYLTFGTGASAGDTVDPLFGEAQATTAPNQNSFFARFFPPSVVEADPNFNGLLDTRGVVPTPTNAEASIDIRNYKVNTTIVYCVRFSAGLPGNYPLVVEYNTADFPVGAQLYVRDNVNGQILSTDMRRATSIGGTRRAFTIRDASVTGFCIEYTLPQVVQFPEIKRGWNLVSLPVSPSNARSEIVFPNIASGKPLAFTQNQYLGDDSTKVGVGYFVKYGQTIDRTIAGTQIRRIHENPQLSPFRVRLYQGWNTVGGLSVPTSIEFMDFGPLPGRPAPRRTAEVYRYVTDRGYEQVSLIIPGFGYWIKVSDDGFYRLDAPPGAFDPKTAPGVEQSYQALNRLTVSDDAQKVGTVYFGNNTAVNQNRFELPPAPASDMFDVRFGNNGFVSTTAKADGDHVVKFQGVEYPVVLSVANPDADYVVSDAVTGQVIGSFKAGQAGALRVTSPMTKSVKLTRIAWSAMELGAAFPNPTNGKAAFMINTPAEENVTVTLFNSLGGEVMSLFRGQVTGTQMVEFSTDALPAGVYYYKMTNAEGQTQIRQIVISK